MSPLHVLRSPLLLVFCGVMGVVMSARAANFVWDINTGTNGAQDGAGTWQDGAGNWFDETTPLQNQTWSNVANNTAVFGAGSSGGAVTVSGTVNTNGMLFRAIGTGVGTAYSFTGGTIALADSSTITVLDNATTVASRLTINSALSGSNITVQRTGGGTNLALMVLGGSNTWSGTLSLASADNAGLFFQANALNSLPSASLTGVSVGQNVTLVLAVSGGSWAVPFTLTGTGAGLRGAIRFESNTTLTGGITLAGNTLITQNTSSTTSVINSAIGETGGARALTLGTQGSSTGTIALGGNNTFTGGLTIDVTNVRIDNVGALNSTAPNRVTFASSAVAKNLSLNGRSITVSGLSSSGGAGAITVRNQNATAATLTISSTADLAYGGVLADGTGGGALSIIKTGTFAQALSGNNTFTGGLTLTQGALNLNSATALGAASSAFTINGGSLGNTSGGTITISNNNAIVLNGDVSASLANALDLGTGAVSLGTAAGTARVVTVSAGTLTLGGNISDGTTATGLTKSGAGILVLGGTSSYTGVTTVTAGNLRVRSNGALGSTAAGTQVNSGRLQLENNITVTGEALITPYLENVSGSNTWDGTVQALVAAQLTFDAAAGSLLIKGNVNAASTDSVAHTFNLIGSGTGEIQGVVSNAASVQKSGTGTWIFSGANTYTTVTNVSAGSLQVGKAGVGQTGTGAVTVAANANLYGTGSVRGSSFTLSNNANLYAGDGTAVTNHGTLTFAPLAAASYSLASGSKINLDLATATANDASFGGSAIGSAGYNTWVDSVTGTGNHDRLVFNGSSGTLTFSSTVTVLSDGYTPQAGDVFNLLDWSALLTADFSGFATGTNFRTGSEDNGSQFDLPDISASGLFWDVSRFTVSGNIVVVPEPGRMLLLGVGLAFGIARRRRVRQMHA